MCVWCRYEWCIYPWSLTLVHVCMMQVWMMHISTILDPGAMMQVWMMHISVILDPSACIHDAGLFRYGRTDERTDGQADSRSWMSISSSWVRSYLFWTHCLYHSSDVRIPKKLRRYKNHVWISKDKSAWVVMAQLILHEYCIVRSIEVLFRSWPCVLIWHEMSWALRKIYDKKEKSNIDLKRVKSWKYKSY